MATINWMNTSRADVTSDIHFALNTRTTSIGIKFLDLAYKNKKLLLQTPKMCAPFGINTQCKSEDRFEITLRFEENISLHNQFHRMLKAIEDYVIQYMFEHQEILGVNGKTYEIIADKLCSCIKQHQQYGKSIVPKVETIDGKFKVNIFNANNVAGAKVTAKSLNHVLIEIPSVWISSGRFGIQMKCIQMQTFASEEKIIEGCAIVDLKE